MKYPQLFLFPFLLFFPGVLLASYFTIYAFFPNPIIKMTIKNNSGLSLKKLWVFKVGDMNENITSTLKFEKSNFSKGDSCIFLVNIKPHNYKEGIIMVKTVTEKGDTLISDGNCYFSKMFGKFSYPKTCYVDIQKKKINTKPSYTEN